ncbi:hypothetical protein [Anaerospora hongkongensis]|uniref:hypothetical protein n=1 Tax=Anaerospora hongkongensis TaxID=244830 RepID=UPI00289D219E|nr:hypothetical protein [Anaerospora hongkongensis]
MAAETRTHFNKAIQKNDIDTCFSNYFEFVKKYVRQVLMRERNLGEKDVDAWIKENVGDFKKKINDHQNSIALARFNDMRDVVASTQNSICLLNATEKEVASRYVAPESIAETYGKISVDFYQYVRNVARNGLVAKQTGTSLIQHTINLNGTMLYQYTQKDVSIPYNQLVAANQNIWDKGKFLAYDIETMGGINHTGQQVLDAVTAFSFGMADSKTGTIGDFYSSVIGQDYKMHKEFTNVINRYESGAEMSDRDMGILKRLAKTGHLNTNYQEMPGQSGLFKFTSYASDADIKAMNTRDMRRGADRYLDIYNQQKKSIVTYQGKQMLAWEKRFIEGLHVRQTEDITALGHNSGSFNLEMMKRFTQGNMLSANAKSVMHDLGLGFNWQNRHMDTLACLRATRSDRWSDIYTEAVRKAMKEEELTCYCDPAVYNNYAAHIGKIDIAVNASMYVQSGLFNPDGADYIFHKAVSEPRALMGGRKMFFYAHESMGMDSNLGGMMSFVDDVFTGDIRTFGGYGISNNGVVHKELFNQSGFQRGVSYTLDSIYEHEMTDQWGNVIADTHPGMVAERIVTATFNPEAGDESFEALSSVTLVGTREDIECRINQQLILTRYKQDGCWHTTKDAIDYLSEIEIGPDGKETNVGFTVVNQLSESKFHLQNESTTRARRGFVMNKQKGLLEFLNDVEKYVKYNADENASVDVRTALRKEFHEAIRNQSLDVAHGVTKRELSLPGVNMLKTYQEYFGWRQREGSGEWRVYREIVDAALKSENYANSIRDIMSVVIDAAEKRGGTDRKLQDFYFKQYFTGLQGYMAKNTATGIESTNTETLRVRAIDRNKFEVNMDGYGHRPGIKVPSIYDDNSDIFSINLKTSNLTLADRLIQKRGFTGVTDESEKIKEIHHFMSHLNNKGIISSDRVVSAEELETHTSETLTQHLLDSLRTVRKNTNGQYGEAAGRILIGKRQNVTTVSNMAKLGFGKEAIQNILREIDKTLPNARFLNKNNIHSEAENIVKNLLFDNVEMNDLFKLGYTEDQAKDLMNMRNIRMNDTISFIKDFMAGIHKTGAELLYNEDVKEFNLIADGIQTRLGNLPRDLFQDGRFYTEIGNMKVSSPVGLYTSKWDKNLKFQSLIGKAHDDLYWMDTAFERGMKEGDLAGQINRIIGCLAKSLRESSSVMKGDMQDSRYDFAFSMYDVVPKLQDLYGQGVFKGIKFEQHKEMIVLLNGEKLDPERLTYRARSLITFNARNILQGIVRDSGDSSLKDMINKFSWDNKEITGLVGTLFNKSHLCDVYGAAKCGIHQHVSRDLRFNADDAKATITSKALKDVSSSRNLYMATEVVEARRKLSGMEYVMESAVRVSRLSMRTGDLRKLSNSADIKNQYVKEILTNIYLDDGAAVAALEMFDSIFHIRATTQKIALYKINEHNLNTIDDLKAKRNLAPQLLIGTDGKITFEYRNGVFVHQGEFLTNVGGYNDTVQETYAQEAGMFRFGILSKRSGLMVDEKSVIQTLTRHKDQIMSAADMEQEAYRILNNNYELAYYIKAFDANPLRKIAEGSSEKNMARFLVGSLGTSGDGPTTQILKTLNLGSFLHEVPDKEYIESLGVALRGAIGDSDFLNPGKTFQAISNNSEAELKHQDSPGVIKRVADNLLYNYSSDANKEQNILKDAIPGFEVKNSQLVAPNGNIYLDKRQAVINNPEHNLKITREVNGIEADLSQIELVAMDFYDHEATVAANATQGLKKVTKGVKFTDRNSQMMEWERYNEESLARVREAVVPEVPKIRFAHVLDDYDAIKKEHQKQAITKSIGDQSRCAMFVQPGDVLLMQDGEINQVIKDKLKGMGLVGKTMLGAMNKQGVGYVSQHTIEDRYSVMTEVLASNWNTGNSGYRLADMIGKAGFEVRRLSRIDTSFGGNDVIADAIYGKKLLIDLHMEQLGNNQYAKNDEHYLPLLSPSREFIDPQKQEEARISFQKNASQLEQPQADYSSSGIAAEKDKILNSMRNTVAGAKIAVSESLTVKQQGAAALGAVRLLDSGRFKASGIECFGNETSAYHRQLEFDGMNLVLEAARKGAEYDATFVGRSFMNTIYNDEYFSGFGLTQEEVFEHSKSKGTLSLNVHEPAGYKKSVSVSAVYLSDVITDNMALSTIAQFEYKKGIDAQLTEETEIFKDASALIHYNAPDNNKLYRAQPEDIERISENLDKYINTLDETDRENHFESLHYGISNWQGQIDDVAKGRKAAACETTRYLYQDRQLIDITSNYEHAAITQDERSAMQKASLGEMVGYHGAANVQRMYEFLTKQLNINEQTKLNNLLRDMDYQEAARIFSDFGERIQLSPDLKEYFTQGILTKGVEVDKKRIRTNEVVDSMSRELTIAYDAMSESRMDPQIVQKQLQPSLAGDSAATQAIVRRNASHKVLSDSEQLINTIRSKIGSIGLTGKSLAFGALGLAGAVMVAGFVGGHPSRPAETQAQDDAEGEYRIPVLSDSNLPNVRVGPKQGYVININAQTSQGQGHASSAIQQALSSGFNNTNINVAMNIHNFGEANTAQISKMLMSAFQ